MQSLLPEPACCPAPLLLPCHPLTIPFSLASDSVITYHHRPGTLAAVHFPIYVCHCSLERYLPGPSEQYACMASVLVLTLSGPPWASSLPALALELNPGPGMRWEGHGLSTKSLGACFTCGGRYPPWVTVGHLTSHTHDQHQEEGTSILMVKEGNKSLDSTCHSSKVTESGLQNSCSLTSSQTL